MSLVEKLNKELEKYNLEFKTTKEYTTKYKGALIDKNTNTKLDFEIEKCLQMNFINTFAKYCKRHMDLYLTLMKQEGKENI